MFFTDKKKCFPFKNARMCNVVYVYHVLHIQHDFVCVDPDENCVSPPERPHACQSLLAPLPETHFIPPLSET